MNTNDETPGASPAEQNAANQALENGTAQPAEKERPQMIPTSSRVVAVQPRTLLIPKPAIFYFEPMPAKRGEDEGNTENQIERGLHQVDPHRGVSSAPVMPNIELLRSTANPYPNDETHPSVISSKKWGKFVRLSHAVWGILMRKSDSCTAIEIVEAAVKIAGVGLTAKGALKREATNCVMDTLRDLRCYGLVKSDDGSVLAKKTKFEVSPDYLNIQLLSELEEAEVAAEMEAAAVNAA